MEREREREREREDYDMEHYITSHARKERLRGSEMATPNSDRENADRDVSYPRCSAIESGRMAPACGTFGTLHFEARAGKELRDSEPLPLNVLRFHL